MARRLTRVERANRDASRYAASVRGEQRRKQNEVILEWFGEDVQNVIHYKLYERMDRAVRSLRKKVVSNIGTSVGISFGPRGGIQIKRSRYGEYPRLDSGLLAAGIFGTVHVFSKNVIDGYVGTPHQHGLILETSEKLNRGFLVRTLKEHSEVIRRILGVPFDYDFGTVGESSQLI